MRIETTLALFATAASLAIATPWTMPVADASGSPSAEAVPASSPEEEVLAAVERIFEGMRTADSAMVREALAEGARFALIDDRGDESRIAFMPVDGWVEAIAGSGGRWDERIYDVEVQVDGGMASVWAPYTFYLDGAVRHCGINSVELLRSGSGWKATQVSDTRRTDGCPDPR